MFAVSQLKTIPDFFRVPGLAVIAGNVVIFVEGGQEGIKYKLTAIDVGVEAFSSRIQTIQQLRDLTRLDKTRDH